MNTLTPETEIREIFQKSIRMLSVRESQLSDARKLLKKSVSGISRVLQGEGEDVEINNVLNSMEESVDHNKFDLLDNQLDDFFELAKYSGNLRKIADNNDFFKCLKRSLEGFKWSEHAEDYVSMIKDLADKKLSNDKTSLQFLKIINNVSYLSKDKYCVEENKNIDLLIKNISDDTDFKYSRNSGDASVVLNDFSLELIKHIYSIKDKDSNVLDNDHLDSDNLIKKITSVLTDIVNGLVMSSDNYIQQQSELLKLLNGTKNTKNLCGDVVTKTIALVNDNATAQQLKNNELEKFIIKINKQLLGIKSHINLSQQDRSETVNRSSALQESVDASVDLIEDKVSSAIDINELKMDISVQLKKIRKQVEKNKVTEKENEDISKESFSSIASELSIAQQELTALKTQLKETKSQLLRDSLTGLYNRVAYEDRIQIEINRSKRNKTPLSIAMWDIDYFKNINDEYGHDVGDRVLKSFSDLIQARIRKTDMFARVGGEEFVLLMPDTESNLALSFNNELRESLSKCKFNYNDKSFSVTASVGIANFIESDTEESFLKNADISLYKSKSEGRNCCTIFNKADL